MKKNRKKQGDKLRSPSAVSLDHRRVDMILSGLGRVERRRWYVTLRFGRVTKLLAVSERVARWLRGEPMRRIGDP